MKEPPPMRKDRRNGQETISSISSIATIAFYVVALAFSAFACIWFLFIRPPRSPEEFLLLWLILFLGGTTVYHLWARSD